MSMLKHVNLLQIKHIMSPRVNYQTLGFRLWESKQEKNPIFIFNGVYIHLQESVNTEFD